ncbi:MAG TPA: GtrA family protein [Actinobacteria bacterium]|jgi:putative flippase GtrA|nr:GtrA family protein [Actinomycetota bacterium]
MTQTSVPPQPRGRIATTVAVLRVKFEKIISEAAKFGVVGLMALVIDVGLFNLLLVADSSMFASKPLTAKVISVTAATTFAYFGNRFWTFRDRGRTSYRREYVLFFVLNIIGMGIALGCLWFTHYALGFDSIVADNISANVIGLALGTIFRFWSYRKWVFPEETDVSDKELVQLSEI